MSYLKSPVCDYFTFLRYRWLNLNSILIICDTILYLNSSGYVAWGLLISLQPPFYPSEAEKKGDNSFFYQCLNFLVFSKERFSKERPTPHLTTCLLMLQWKQKFKNYWYLHHNGFKNIFLAKLIFSVTVHVPLNVISLG